MVQIPTPEPKVQEAASIQDGPPLELNKENLLRGLLQYNYFPRTHDQKEEMPEIFSSVKFTPDIATKLLAIQYRKKGGYDIMPFRRTRHPNIPRMMGIPHPRAYVELVKNITDNWDEHIQHCCQSENSSLTFEVQPDYRIIVHKYDRLVEDGELQNPDYSLDFGMKYRIKTDITNFYHSIYSHSLPWALVTHKVAKKQRDAELWYNRIDGSVQLCQRGETKGVPIGPATSSILSEIILFQVDKALREKGYRFSRYIDDYTGYEETKSRADQFLSDLTKELERYALALNPKKTTILEMPVPTKEKWVTEINLYLGLDEPDGENQETKIGFKQLRLIIDRAIALSAESPDGSVIKYAFSAVLDKGVRDHEAEIYLLESLLKYAFYFPALVPLYARWGQSWTPFTVGNVGKRFLKLLSYSLDQGQTDNTVWCLYFLLQLAEPVGEDVLLRCFQDGAPMVMLMGYLFAQRRKMSIAPIKAWAKEKGRDLSAQNIDAYDIDRYWLVFYQLYFDNVISAPPYTDVNDKKVFETMKSEGVTFVDMGLMPDPIAEMFSSVKLVGDDLF